jgi:hypothetical protein
LKLKREENPNKKGPKFKEMVFTLQIAGNVDFNYQGNMEELVQQNVHKARSKLIFSPWVLK